MSLLHRDGPRRFSRPTSARTFPETYYNERHTPLDYTRADPYAYPMGGPVSGLRPRSHMDRPDFEVEQTSPRRRIAVACARCRKRKIRCSGDKGDGISCYNCRQAGVDSSQCQFHRVGSDHVHKVLDNFSMAQSLVNMTSAQDMISLYSNGGNSPYHRTMQSQQYPQLEYKSRYPQLIDTKPTYASEWSIPYGEDTSPIESYSLDQSSAYPPAPVTAGSNADSSTYRWTHPTARSVQPTTNYYSDYGNSYIPNGMSYLQSDFQSPAANEPVSPLNMSSLQLTLPERPRQRQLRPTEIPLAPRRRLPAPQPHPSHGLHHALDQQQGQRLRSSQTIATPSYSNVAPSLASPPSFTKPLLPWTTANENLMNVANETVTAAIVSPATTLTPTSTADTSPSFLSTTSAENTATSTGSASSTELSFNTSLLLDPSTMDTPTPPTYSNFRESRDLSESSATQLPRNNSATSLYTYDNAARRPFFPGKKSSGNLVSGHSYTPLSQTNHVPIMENITPGSFERRSSSSNLASSF
ncbi:hypothetical protein EKO04_009903 [Ascochyta lentis]|uniref:Zn(2)-C6 fungal-type domain-containing protein n=1 Tax=Ascochyta lentis TaxID=205686 RepID=A0A8H7MG87_9PLEO|nr:hypothetical protein EKO04_009903 [Ascochyta lentis]